MNDLTSDPEQSRTVLQLLAFFGLGFYNLVMFLIVRQVKVQGYSLQRQSQPTTERVDNENSSQWLNNLLTRYPIALLSDDRMKAKKILIVDDLVAFTDVVKLVLKGKDRSEVCVESDSLTPATPHERNR